MKTTLENTLKISVGGRKKMFPHHIILLVAEINYTKLYLINGEWLLVAKCLKELEGRLQEFNFFRSHRSFLINLSFVQEVDQTSDCILLIDNLTAKISRRRRFYLQQKLITESHPAHFYKNITSA